MTVPSLFSGDYTSRSISRLGLNDAGHIWVTGTPVRLHVGQIGINCCDVLWRVDKYSFLSDRWPVTIDRIPPQYQRPNLEMAHRSNRIVSVGRGSCFIDNTCHAIREENTRESRKSIHCERHLECSIYGRDFSWRRLRPINRRSPRGKIIDYLAGMIN